MHAKDSQHDCRTRSQSTWKTSARLSSFGSFFSPFSFFCSPGVHTQRFAIVGLAGAFIRATTFVSGVNFRSEAQPLSRGSRARSFSLSMEEKATWD